MSRTRGWLRLEVKLRAFGGLKKHIGPEITIDLKDNASLETLISALTLRTKSFRKGYIGPYKAGADLTVLVNGRNMNTLQKPIRLKNGDIVELVPFSVGG